MKTLQTISLVISASFLCSCSVLKESKVTGLGELGVWKEESARIATKAPGSAKSDYQAAADKVNAYINTSKSKLTIASAKTFGSVDLSSETIPEDTRNAVDKFLAHDPAEADPVSGAVILAAAKKIWDGFLKPAIEESRKAEAEAAKGILDDSKWSPWDEVR